MRLLTLVFLLLFLNGCGRSAPTLAGGKPVSHWVEELHNPDAKLRKEAAFKLGNVGITDAQALPALLGALTDPDATVRCEVILALVKFGSAAREAVPKLLEYHEHDPDPKVREYAGKALAKVRP